MGLGGVLARKVFFKNRSSDGIRDGQQRHFGADKSKWISVKNYLCGDEFNSLVAEDDFDSTRRTETILMESEEGERSVIEEESVEQNTETENLLINVPSQEKAAIIIQSAFRGFRIWKQYQENKQLDITNDNGEFEWQSETTEALSTKAQVGDSVEAVEAQEKIVAVSRYALRNARSQMSRIKEEWDDSILSSNVLKLRIQNKLEAMTRRERALAYAFSQQLRTCSKKKSSRFDASDPGKGWSWLERWMATRSPKNSMAEGCLRKHLEPTYNKRPINIRKRLDVGFEEKESCGSNDVQICFNSTIEASQVPLSGYSHAESMFKATKCVTKRIILPEQHKKKGNKLCKKDSSRKTEKEKRCKPLNSKEHRKN